MGLVIGGGLGTATMDMAARTGLRPREQRVAGLERPSAGGGRRGLPAPPGEVLHIGQHALYRGRERARRLRLELFWARGAAR
jgi:hypothetical protein